MEVFGLSGKSGTGKSYNAAQLCSNLGIESMVDDGLYIWEGSIIAGISAKKESTRLGAVRRAIFTDESHRAAVAAAIREKAPEKILIIGTSDDMVRLICEKLGLDPPVRIIHIEEITTANQRKIARKSRDEGGIHVIPAPTFEVKRQFSGYFIDAKKGFRKAESENPPKEDEIERTVVRPTYSYLGSFEISNKVIHDIVQCVASRIPGCADILWVSSDNSPEGMYIRIIMLFGRNTPVRTTAGMLQDEVYRVTAAMTAFNILGVEIEARGLRRQSSV